MTQKINDVVPELLQEIQDEFDKLCKQDIEIQRILEIIASGKGTYEDANEYAIRLGEILSKAYLNKITKDILPDGKMYYNIAKRTIEPTMLKNFELVSDASLKVQSSLNKAAKINLKPIPPQLNQFKVDSIINKVTSNQFEKVAFILQDPIVHFSQEIVDDSIKRNAEFHSQSGLHPKITRKVRGGCCEWCMNLAGTYSYPEDLPDDIYRRHDRCRCEVLYDPGEGKQVQNVHTKSWENREKDIQRRIEFSTSKVSKYAEDVTAEYFGTANPGEGSISYDNGYDVSSHQHEVQMANFLFEKFGGDFHLLSEADEDGVKMPDYIWNKKYWELKSTSTTNASKTALRKALQQLKEDGGGIILDYREGKNIDKRAVMSNVDYRLKRSGKADTDVMIIYMDNDIKIFRYKK